MRQIGRWLGMMALVLFSAAAVAQQQFEAGRDYVVLDNPQSTAAKNAVEVREFFSYACPHCFTFVAPMHDWLENRAPAQIEYVRTPVVFNEAWRLLAQTYHTAEILGVLDQTHVPVFTALHSERRRFRDVDDMADFFASLGVDRERFVNTIKSFAVDMRMRQSEQNMRNFRISSTPSVAVAGKYVVTPRTAGSQERMIEVIDYLVRQEAAKLP